MIAQGWEAGGHTGRFLDAAAEPIGLFALLPLVATMRALSGFGRSGTDATLPSESTEAVASSELHVIGRPGRMLPTESFATAVNVIVSPLFGDAGELENAATGARFATVTVCDTVVDAPLSSVTLASTMPLCPGPKGDAKQKSASLRAWELHLSGRPWTPRRGSRT